MIRTFDLVLPHGITLACRTAAAGPAGDIAATSASAVTDATSHGNSRPRVLLLHGFPEAAFVWDDVMQALAVSAVCVAPNLRGYPGSSAPVEVSAYKARLLVADLVAAIDTLGGPVDLLVAHDWGGALAWSLAAARPDLMKRMLIINAPHPATFLRELRHSTAQQAASGYMNFLCRPDAAALLAESGFRRLWRLFGDAPWLTPALRAMYADAWSRGLVGPLNYYRASPLRPATAPGDALNTLVLPDEAVRVRVPTTVLWGLDDIALRPGLLDGLERWVPGVAVERVEGASHWIVHEQASRVVESIRRLLSDA